MPAPLQLKPSTLTARLLGPEASHQGCSRARSPRPLLRPQRLSRAGGHTRSPSGVSPPVELPPPGHQHLPGQRAHGGQLATKKKPEAVEMCQFTFNV